MQSTREEDIERRQTSSPPPAVVVTFVAAILAGIAGGVASGAMAWVAVGAVALGGAYFASRAAGPRRLILADVAKPRRLLLLLDRGGTAECKLPADFTGEWATLFERVNRLVYESRSQMSPTPGSELDQFRNHTELAASLLRDGKDPLAEAPELRAGPLQSLLEGVKSSSSLPLVSHLSLGEEELIGEGGDTLPPDWPKPTGEAPARASGDLAPAFASGLRELIREIEALRTTLAGGRNGEAPTANEDSAARTPAQLVDAVVLTAADGIEDLAAGLMRANELASVAERVTNRATLLALNAALEATRSGSEAFAAIAEETRRLAEFAREATDTISRLSSEIEYKVGETITAIHATSEDAKTSLAEMSGSGVPVPSPTRNARVQVVRLLDRSRQLLNSLGAPAPQAQAETGPARQPNSAEEHVENATPPADNIPMEGILLIEGLKPGARLES